MTIHESLAERYVRALKSLEGSWRETERVVREVYDTNIEFTDPAFRIVGIEPYVRLMERMLQGAKRIHVEPHTVAESGDEVLVRLTLTYEFRIGGTMRIDACSSATFEAGKVVQRRDFWDSKDALLGIVLGFRRLAR